MANWYYKQEGEEVGPADEELLGVLVDLGHIDAETEVREEERQDWTRAGRSALAPLFGLQAPAPQPSAEPVPAPASARTIEATANLRPPNASLQVFFRSVLIALMVISLCYALLFTLFALDLLKPSDSVATAFRDDSQLGIDTLSSLLRYIVGAVVPALLYTSTAVIGIAQAVTGIVTLLMMLLYLHWVYSVAQRVYRAGHPGEATKPNHALLWHIVPCVNLVFPPRLMLRVYRWAMVQQGIPNARRPRALLIWWGATVLVATGLIVEGLFLFVPALRDLAIFGKDQDPASAMPARYLFVVVLLLTLWLAPIGLAAFLWLQRRITRGLYDAVPEMGAR